MNDSAHCSSSSPHLPNYLILSAHDYRTSLRTSIHFTADELVKRGKTRFFSLRYSYLSRLKKDIRLSLDDQANRCIEYRGVECYLWRAMIHPMNTRIPSLACIEDLMFRFYKEHYPPILKQWMTEANVIIFESGVSAIFIGLAKALNPTAKLIYRASDGLSTINVAQYVKKSLARHASDLEIISLVSPAMAAEIPQGDNVYHVGHGVDTNLHTLGDPSPYDAGTHMVSVGSMLFDPRFFIVAGRAFPHVTFHVIGSGKEHHPDYTPNIRVYGEMKFAKTVRYIKHAAVGIAPYGSQDVPIYLADSSMKLLQYDYFGIPAVCPHIVVGQYATRFGYEPGDSQSIVAALNRALQAPRERTRLCLNWSDTVDRILDPQRYPDTALQRTSQSAFASVAHPK